VLLRRKWWIIGTFLVFTLGALAYGLQQQRVYAYTTSIELGEFGPEEFVAGAASTASTISDRILLSAKRAFLRERDLGSMPFDMSVNTPEESSFVNLVSRRRWRISRWWRNSISGSLSACGRAPVPAFHHGE